MICRPTFALLLVIAASACKKSPPAEETPAAATARAPTPAAPPPVATGKTGSGTITGTVVFKGKLAPAPGPKTSFPECNRGPGPADRTLLLSGSGGVKNAFVWIKQGLEGAYPPPADPAKIDQHHCEFEPRVVGVRVGQPVIFVNSDAFLHNVKSAGFNVAMPTAGFRVTRTFTKPEVMASLSCEVHAWMHAYVGVVPHPFFAVTDADGNFRIANLPAGNFTIEVWHERLGRTQKPIKLAERASEIVPIELKAP